LTKYKISCKTFSFR